MVLMSQAGGWSVGEKAGSRATFFEDTQMRVGKQLQAAKKSENNGHLAAQEKSQLTLSLSLIGLVSMKFMSENQSSWQQFWVCQNKAQN